MNNNIQIFDYCNKKVRTVMKNDELWFVLKDVCDTLSICNHKNIARKLDTDEKEVHIMDSLGGAQKITIVSEAGLYKTIFKSYKPEAKNFMRWVTHEVLPSIRKHGAYISREKLQGLSIENALNIINAQRKEIQQLSLKIEEDKPKVLFSDAVTISACTIDIGELAKILKANGIDIGQNRMFEYMRMDGFLMKRRSAWNYPTQKAMNLKLFEIKKTIYLQGAKTLIVRSNVQVTGKGQIYFLNKFLTQKNAVLLNDKQLNFDNFGE